MQSRSLNKFFEWLRTGKLHPRHPPTEIDHCCASRRPRVRHTEILNQLGRIMSASSGRNLPTFPVDALARLRRHPSDGLDPPCGLVTSGRRYLLFITVPRRPSSCWETQRTTTSLDAFRRRTMQGERERGERIEGKWEMSEKPKSRLENFTAAVDVAEAGCHAGEQAGMQACSLEVREKSTYDDVC